MKCIYFCIDIRILKIIKVFKNPSYIEVLKSREDSMYLFLYSTPIYKGNICFVSETKGISFKSYANQVLNMFINQSKEHIEWKPNIELDLGKK